MPVMTLKRINPVSLAKQAGVLYAFFGLIIGAIIALVSLAGMAASVAAESGAPAWMGALFGVGAVIFMPILYGCLGLIGGLIVGALYNFVAGFTGGVEVELS